MKKIIAFALFLASVNVAAQHNAFEDTTINPR
jgi:hypothetical protein